MTYLLSIILLFTFFFSSLGQFSLVSLGSGGALKLYLFDASAGFYAFLGLLYLLNLKKLKMAKYMIPAVLFLIFALVTLIFGMRNLDSSAFLVSCMYWVRLSVYILVSIVTFNLISLDKKFGSKVVTFMLLSGVFVGVCGLIQLIVLPDFRALPAELGWDPHINRLSSTFFDPNFTGGYLVLCLVLSGLLLVERYAKTKKLNMILAYASFFYSLCILLTFSRSAWLMAAICVFVIGIFKSRKLLIVTFLLMFLTYYAVPRVQTRLSGVTDPADSARFRLLSWQNTLRISEDNLILGVGFNAFRYAQESYGFFDYRNEVGGHAGAGSDSSLLLVLATTGIVGLALYLWMYGYLILGSFEQYLKNGSTLALVMLVSLCGLLIQSQFVNSLFYPQYLLWFWLLPALVLKN